MSLIVKKGTGKNARVEGYAIGAKTGTADKPGSRGYSGQRVISSFIAAFPINNPRYVILALIDEPRGIKRTRGYATGGWVAAPIISRVVKRMAPMLGLAPEYPIKAQPAKSKRPVKKRVKRLIVASRKNDFGAVVKTVNGLKGKKKMSSGNSKRNTRRSKPSAAN